PGVGYQLRGIAATQERARPARHDESRRARAVTVGRPLFVVNPAAAGGRAARLLPTIQSRVARGGGSVVCTTGPGHAMELARRAADDGFDAVVGVCGDGTLNE